MRALMKMMFWMMVLGGSMLIASSVWLKSNRSAPWFGPFDEIWWRQGRLEAARGKDQPLDLALILGPMNAERAGRLGHLLQERAIASGTFAQWVPLVSKHEENEQGLPQGSARGFGAVFARDEDGAGTCVLDVSEGLPSSAYWRHELLAELFRCKIWLGAQDPKEAKELWFISKEGSPEFSGALAFFMSGFFPDFKAQPAGADLMGDANRRAKSARAWSAFGSKMSFAQARFEASLELLENRQSSWPLEAGQLRAHGLNEEALWLESVMRQDPGFARVWARKRFFNSAWGNILKEDDLRCPLALWAGASASGDAPGWASSRSKEGEQTAQAVERLWALAGGAKGMNQIAQELALGASCSQWGKESASAKPS